jgi:hypothetical protein
MPWRVEAKRQGRRLVDVDSDQLEVAHRSLGKLLESGTYGAAELAPLLPTDSPERGARGRSDLFECGAYSHSPHLGTPGVTAGTAFFVPHFLFTDDF